MSRNSSTRSTLQQDVSVHPVRYSTPPPQTSDFPTRLMRRDSPTQEELYSQPPSPSTPPPPPPPPPPISNELRSSLGVVHYQRAEVELLKHASAEGRPQDVQQILSQYISSQPDSSLQLQIFHESITEAIRHKNPAILSFLLSKSVGAPKLFIPTVIEFPSSAIFQTFLNFGWNINEPLERIKPPALGYISDDRALTQWFLDHGADPNARCDWDYTPMSIAVYQGSLSSIKMLFDRGGNINQGQLLHNAVQRCNPDVIDVVIYLLDQGASINEIQYQNDEKSWGERHLFGLGTPLHYAAQLGNVELVKLLLARGADPKIKNTKNRTALQAAEYYNQSKVIDFLAYHFKADNS